MELLGLVGADLAALIMGKGAYHAGATRFAAWPVVIRRAILAFIVLLIAWGVIAQPTAINAQNGVAATTGGAPTDRLLYERIIADMRAGGGYYEVAAPALREGDYPLKPFLAFRLPTLATLLAVLPPLFARVLMIGLIAATALVWFLRFKGAFPRATSAALATTLIILGASVLTQPSMIVFHEVWAAALIALSLGLRQESRWLLAVLVGIAAVLIRETALPYLLAMATFALWQGNRREAIGWGVGVLLFCAALALHAHAVAEVVTPVDPISPGWSARGGWIYFLSAMRLTTPLTLFPFWLTAILIPLSMLGWAAWHSSTGLRALAIVTGYGLMIMLFARPDNFYWGVLIAPLLLAGLAFVPAALRDLLQPGREPPPIST